jgi:hypothetical protein
MSLVDVSRDQFTRALYRRCGVGRAISVDQLAHAIGRSGRTIRGWVAGHFSPKLEDIYALCRFFGPAFADEIMPPEIRREALRRYHEDRDALLAIVPARLAWLVPPAIDEPPATAAPEVAPTPAAGRGR